MTRELLRRYQSESRDYQRTTRFGRNPLETENNDSNVQVRKVHQTIDQTRDQVLSRSDLSFPLRDIRSRTGTKRKRDIGIPTSVIDVISGGIPIRTVIIGEANPVVRLGRVRRMRNLRVGVGAGVVIESAIRPRTGVIDATAPSSREGAAAACIRGRAAGTIA